MAVLRDKERIEAYLRQDPYLHLYEIGDLDAPYWEHTTWFGAEDRGQLAALALFYTGVSLPVLLAFDRGNQAHLLALLRKSMDQLPSRFYTHLSKSLVGLFSGTHRIESHGCHLKMAWTHPNRADDVDTGEVIELGPADFEEMKRFYDASYPGHWFEKAMLSCGPYVGIRLEGKLVCVAGVHVFSRRYRIAALGNIATDPALRGHGLATTATSGLLALLRPDVDHVGLNVKEDNLGAICCYERLGFERVAPYEEFLIEVR